MKKALLLLISLFSITSYSQTYLKDLGIENRDDGATSIIKSENGFIISGYSNNDAYLLEINEKGKVLWRDSYSFSTQKDLITDIKYINGKILACGYGYYEGTGNFLEFIFKYDIASKSFDWIKKTKLVLKPATIHILPNGNILVTGDEIYIEEFKVFLMELDFSTGKMNHYSSWNFTGNESASSSVIHNNHIYLGGRYALEKKIDKYRGAISKFDFNFKEIWSNYYLNKKENILRNYLNKLIIDNGEIISLYSTNNRGISNFYTISLAKQTLDGKMLWAKEYGIEGYINISVRDIKATKDGYYIYGFTVSPAENLFIIKIDKQGKVKWSKTYGTSKSENIIIDQGHFMETTKDNIYIVAQSKSVSSPKYYNSILIKLNHDGSTSTNCWGKDAVVKTKNFQELIQGGIYLNGNDSIFISNNLSYKKTTKPVLQEYPYYCFPNFATNDLDTITNKDTIEIDFLKNDILPKDLLAEFKIIDKPNNATASIINSKIIYTKINSDICKKDSFRYILITSQRTDTATVFVYTLKDIEIEKTETTKIMPLNKTLVLETRNKHSENIYNWSTGETTQKISITKYGNYTVKTVRNECIYQEGFTVEENPYSFENVASTNITFLIDASISMNRSNRLPVLKNALYKILSFMREEDKLSIINYSNNAKVIFDGVKATELDLIQSKIDSLLSKGNSNIKEGLKMAIKTIENNFVEHGNNKIIFTTDGDISNENREEFIDYLNKNLPKDYAFTIFLFNDASIFKTQMNSVTKNLYNITPENVDEILLKEFKSVRK